MIQSIAGVIPLTPSIKARVEVDVAVAHSMDLFEHPEHLIGRFRKTLAGVAESVAQDVSPGCVYVRHAGKSERNPMCEVFIGRWMPPPGSPSELRGGPRDGQTIQQLPDENGMPREVVRMPLPDMPLTNYRGLEFPLPSTDRVIDYHLIGFRNDPAVWVYEARP